MALRGAHTDSRCWVTYLAPGGVGQIKLCDAKNLKMDLLGRHAFSRQLD